MFERFFFLLNSRLLCCLMFVCHKKRTFFTWMIRSVFGSEKLSSSGSGRKISWLGRRQSWLKFSLFRAFWLQIERRCGWDCLFNDDSFTMFYESCFYFSSWRSPSSLLMLNTSRSQRSPWATFKKKFIRFFGFLLWTNGESMQSSSW